MVDPLALALEMIPATSFHDSNDLASFLNRFDTWARERFSRNFLEMSPGEISRVAMFWVVEHSKEYRDQALKAVDPVERDDVFRRYMDAINMTLNELETWADDPCSREASLSRAPIDRNLRLLGKPREEWDDRDVRDAKRTISFVARMSQGEQGEPVSEECPLSRRDISLLNWAFDPRKSRT